MNGALEPRFPDGPHEGPPRPPGQDTRIRRVPAFMVIAALSVGGAAFLAGWSDLRAIVAMWAASMAVAITMAILMGRDPEVRRYRQEYEDWRAQQLARGRSRRSLALEVVRSTTAEHGLKRRDLAILLLHVLIVLVPTGAVVSLISFGDRLW